MPLLPDTRGVVRRSNARLLDTAHARCEQKRGRIGSSTGGPLYAVASMPKSAYWSTQQLENQSLTSKVFRAQHLRVQGEPTPSREVLARLSPSAGPPVHRLEPSIHGVPCGEGDARSLASGRYPFQVARMRFCPGNPCLHRCARESTGQQEESARRREFPGAVPSREATAGTLSQCCTYCPHLAGGSTLHSQSASALAEPRADPHGILVRHRHR